MEQVAGKINSNPIIRFLSQDFIEDPELKVLSRDTYWWEYETSLPKEVVETMFSSFIEIEEWA